MVRFPPEHVAKRAITEVQIFRDAAFDPDRVRALCDAYDLATTSLHDVAGPALVNEVIATHIVRLAEKGNLDARTLAERALREIGIESLD